MRLVDRSQAEAGEELPAGMAEHLLYEFLPGIGCYDPSHASRSVVVRAYRGTTDNGTDPADASGEEVIEG